MAQSGPLLFSDSSARQRGRRTFQNGTHFEQVQHLSVAQELDGEAGYFEQTAGVEAGDENAVAVAHVEHAQHVESMERLADGASGNTQPQREIALGRQPIARAELASSDHAHDGGHSLFGGRCGLGAVRARGSGARKPPVACAVVAAAQSVSLSARQAPRENWYGQYTLITDCNSTPNSFARLKRSDL